MLDIFKSSTLELKKIKTITITAMLMAAWLVLDTFSILLIPTIKIKFTFLAFSLISAFFGPVVGMIAGGGTEMISAILFPQGGAFFPGFTLSAILTGLIYGMFLYKKNISFKRCFISKALVNIFINIGLNTFWLYMLTGESIRLLLPARIVKNLILLPIESLLMFIVLSNILKIFKKNDA